MSDAELLELETLLQQLGFDPGAVDGVIDDATLAGIARYQDFASLPGSPEPSAALLGELRGVAAAFAALRNDTVTEVAVEDAPPEEPQLEEPLPEEPLPEDPLPDAAPRAPSPDTGPSQAVPAPSSEGETVTAKTIVPPPPAPPKLKPLEAAPPEQPAAPPPAIAARPPAAEAPASEGPAPQVPDAERTASPADAAVERQAEIEAALRPHRQALAEGSITRDDLARQFNEDGRALLAQADFESAVAHFDVAIFLNPRFAGAYSNRGTAHERMGERDLALEDFATARRLGFGGFRLQ
ncbi:peptidoglycan-binding protein [Pelagibius sp.]|uniref:tetratricopeptide repeat protein n=1 Tax=Pelagibius sp. TaxID=1931238 RepID=UPI00260DF5AB|nr:peptidoglycan-binding protein [Pelagibius sp.]